MRREDTGGLHDDTVSLSSFVRSRCPKVQRGRLILQNDRREKQSGNINLRVKELKVPSFPSPFYYRYRLFLFYDTKLKPTFLRENGNTSETFLRTQGLRQFNTGTLRKLISFPESLTSVVLQFSLNFSGGHGLCTSQVFPVKHLTTVLI